MSYLQGNQYDEFLVRSEQLTGIADALREKTGDTAGIPFADWEGKIRGLSSAKVYQQTVTPVALNDSRNTYRATLTMPDFFPDIITIDSFYHYVNTNTYYEKKYVYVDYRNNTAWIYNGTTIMVYSSGDISSNTYTPTLYSNEVPADYGYVIPFSSCPYASLSAGDTINCDKELGSGSSFKSAYVKFTAIKF